jgi:hypothetical protein
LKRCFLQNYRETTSNYPNSTVQTFLWTSLLPWLRRFIDDPIAIFTMFLTLFNILLWGETKKLAKGGRNAIALATKEFIAAHRPKLLVHSVFSNNFGAQAAITTVSARTGPRQETTWKPGEKLRGTISITNSGDSEATIIGSFCSVFTASSELPMIPPFHGQPDNGFLKTGPLPPGADVEGKFSDPGNDTSGHSPVVEMGVYVLGWITYLDGNHVPRRVVFCRRYDRIARRFAPITHPDYERED